LEGTALLPAPYWQGQGITLYLGDCLSLMPLLRQRFNLVVADLPYGTTRNHWDKELPNKLLWWNYRQLVPPHAPVVLFGTGLFGAELMLSNRTEYRYTLVWDKQAVTGHLNARRQPLRAHEDLYVFYGQQPTYHPQMVHTGRVSHGRGHRLDRTIHHWGDFHNTQVVDQGGWQYPRSILPFRRPKNTKHPNQKPVALCEWLVRTYTDDGATVLDNVCGSATTLVAARNVGRGAVGIELHEPYLEEAARRLESGAEGDRW
jgi:hypothetical protein